MKYRVTEKHAYLRKGLTIEPLHVSCDYGQMIYNLGAEQESLGYDIHLNWLADNWIEEIQEPEFTEKEVISILVKFDCDFVEDSQNCDFVELIKEWKYHKNKRNENKN